ncbi:hydroxymethylglutaryl-CoA lyase [Hirschia baltica]|uniref:Pyruvate carboxyltransferase n=1 Tax=Hirschia baltica (strain ATCC 49814 / DSM 5838 / IFAM 1418) TaxID=582402 RepID=C6XJA3_HIRBI|nr:hydroxymethylglutaryl-CoA lyase [Hirschia baltica]ACT59198.1 pyruvate carboxyltransferase [Hirschia baltica ATCC 49814]
MNILISEVGPRDGLQNVSSIMPTTAKKAWIDAAFAAGIREIEVGSFVPAKLLPQLADTNEIVSYARQIEGLTVAALVPNSHGARNAINAGTHKITLPLSCSESHSIANLRRTHEQVLAEARSIANMIAELPAKSRPHFEGSLSTAFGCTIEGNVPEDKVIELAEALMEAGCDEVGLADTTGYANPTSVKELIKKIWGAVGQEALTGIHLHNTRGLGLANAYAALEVGLTTFDSSLGGLGGCPFAPGASGNLVTEDLVYMFEAMGISTGIDLESLFSVRRLVQESLPSEEFYGFAPEAGLPLGFSPTTPSLPNNQLAGSRS